MEVLEYKDKYKKDFIQFNTDWIVDNFGFLEDEDRDTFCHIEDSLEQGAMIYFAVEDETALATCMAEPMEEEGVWELCKMGRINTFPTKGQEAQFLKRRWIGQ